MNLRTRAGNASARTLVKIIETERAIIERMEQSALAVLARWANFYVITGSSAGALTGLQFVVITLVAQSDEPGSMRTIRAFATPTIVHFCSALTISAIVCAPWYAFSHIVLCLGICGVGGFLYGIRVLMHARKQDGYNPVASDWLWYIVLPMVAYGALLGSAVALAYDPGWSLYAIAAATLSLLFIGIHNAWDAVTYLVVEQRQKRSTDAR